MATTNHYNNSTAKNGLEIEWGAEVEGSDDKDGPK